MAITETTDAVYDPSLPIFIPDPVDATGLLWRHVAASLPPGSIGAWASDLGNPGKVLGQGTAASRPTATLDAFGRVVARFDGTDDTIGLGQPALTPSLTGYIVCTVASVGASRVLVGMGGINVQIFSSGAPRITGTSGAVVSTQTVSVGEKVVIAFTVSSASAVSLVFKGVTTAGALTVGALTSYALSTGSAGAGFPGDIEEISLYSGVHTAPQIAAQMEALREWYDAR